MDKILMNILRLLFAGAFIPGMVVFCLSMFEMFYAVAFLGGVNDRLLWSYVTLSLSIASYLVLIYFISVWERNAKIIIGETIGQTEDNNTAH